MDRVDPHDRLTRWTLIGLALLLAAGLVLYAFGFLPGGAPLLEGGAVGVPPVKHP
jgi:hypothetical protein